MTIKDIGCAAVVMVSLLLIVDSLVYEHPMHPRPEPHNVIGYLIHGEWVRVTEFATGITLILGMIVAAVLISRRQKTDIASGSACDSA
jgi:hypothetical protein